MQEWKMTDKLLANCEHNYGVWKMQDWKMTDKLLVYLRRLKRSVEIRRPKKKRNLQNDTRIKACTARYDAGAYDKLQFLRAISHSLHGDTQRRVSR